MVSAIIGLEHVEIVKLCQRLQGPSIFPGSERWAVLRDLITMDTFQFPSKRAGRLILTSKELDLVLYFYIYIYIYTCVYSVKRIF